MKQIWSKWFIQTERQISRHNLFIHLLFCMLQSYPRTNVLFKDSIMIVQICSKIIHQRQSFRNKKSYQFYLVFSVQKHLNVSRNAKTKNSKKIETKCICVRSKPFKSEIISALTRTLPWVIPGMICVLFAIHYFIYVFVKRDKGTGDQPPRSRRNTFSNVA